VSPFRPRLFCREHFVLSGRKPDLRGMFPSFGQDRFTLFITAFN